MGTRDGTIILTTFIISSLQKDLQMARKLRGTGQAAVLDHTQIKPPLQFGLVVP